MLDINGALFSPWAKREGEKFVSHGIVKSFHKALHESFKEILGNKVIYIKSDVEN